MPTEKKKKELTFKLDYFDLIKGVLFPNRGKPAPKKSASTSTSDVKETAPVAAPTIKPAKKPQASARPFFQAGKLLPAFWTTASVLSFIVNVILIVVLVVVGRQLFALKELVNDHLLGGLYANFILMDRAHIKTNITVKDTIPIKFDLPISTDTVVVLNQDTPVEHVLVQINTGSLTINSYARIVLPAQTNLPVHLTLTVPVETQIPITLNVPVDIPLEKTELHQPFVGLQKVVGPFYWMLQPQIKTANDVPACQGQAGWFCQGFFK
jgi:hypothetical protein